MARSLRKRCLIANLIRFTNTSMLVLLCIGCTLESSGSASDAGQFHADGSTQDDVGSSQEALWGGGPVPGDAALTCQEYEDQLRECIEEMEDIAGGPGPVVDQICYNQADDCLADCDGQLRSGPSSDPVSCTVTDTSDDSIVVTGMVSTEGGTTWCCNTDRSDCAQCDNSDAELPTHCKTSARSPLPERRFPVAVDPGAWTAPQSRTGTSPTRSWY